MRQLRARFCLTVGWPLMAHYGRCPYCGLFVEPTLHPDWEWDDEGAEPEAPIVRANEPTNA